MSKIGIAIKVTSAGAGEPFVVNGGPWTTRIFDVREVMKHVPALASNFANIVTFFSFTEDACLITLVRNISGRPGDNVSGWICIPSNVKISGDQVVGVIQQLKGVISSPQLPDPQSLAAMFSQDYPTLPVAMRYMASKRDGSLAKRILGYYSLQELLGEYRYQQYYSPYRLVFLEDATTGPIQAADISNEKMTQLISFRPASDQLIQSALGKGVMITLPNGQPFRQPIPVNKGSKITLTARREGFEPITFSNTLGEDGQICVLPAGAKWQKHITLGNFVIKSESGQDITGKSKIMVNNKEVTPQGLYFYDSELAFADVTVTAPGYKPYSSNPNLLNGQRISIRLEKKEVSYQRKVVMNNGYTGEITITGKGITKHESPLKGYVEEGSYLEYDTMTVWKQRGIGFLAGIAILLIVLFCQWVSNNTFKWQFGWPPLKVEKIQEAPQPTGTEDTLKEVETSSEENNGQSAEDEFSIKAAIDYLDTHDKWVKEDMEKYPALQGLYDAMNTYNFEEIKEKGLKLGTSAKYKDLLQKICELGNVKLEGPFCNDGEITLEKYLRKVGTKAGENREKKEVKKVKSNSNSNSSSNSSSSNNSNSSNKTDPKPLTGGGRGGV